MPSDGRNGFACQHYFEPKPAPGVEFATRPHSIRPGIGPERKSQTLTTNTNRDCRLRYALPDHADHPGDGFGQAVGVGANGYFDVGIPIRRAREMTWHRQPCGHACDEILRACAAYALGWIGRLVHDVAQMCDPAERIECAHQSESLIVSSRKSTVLQQTQVTRRHAQWRAQIVH